MNEHRIQLLKQYIEEEPDNPFNKYALAMEYYEGEPDKSLALLQDLMTSHPDYLPTYFKAAHLLWEMQEWDQAEGIFKRGIAIAKKQKDVKALKELTSAFQNFQFERE